MAMDETQFKDFLGKFKTALDRNELPEIATFSEDEKRSLRLFLPLVKSDSDIEALARFLPHINTPEKVAAFAFMTKMGAAAIVLSKAARMLMSWPGVFGIVLVAWTFGGEGARDLIKQIMELAK